MAGIRQRISPAPAAAVDGRVTADRRAQLAHMSDITSHWTFLFPLSSGLISANLSVLRHESTCKQAGQVGPTQPNNTGLDCQTILIHVAAEPEGTRHCHQHKERPLIRGSPCNLCNVARGAVSFFVVTVLAIYCDAGIGVAVGATDSRGPGPNGDNLAGPLLCAADWAGLAAHEHPCMASRDTCDAKHLRGCPLFPIMPIETKP